MSVRRKVLLIIAATCLGLMGALYVVARSVILGNARHDEQLTGNRTMHRMQELLDERLSSLKRLSLDHSSFDPTYRLVEHPDPSLDRMLFGENNQTNPLSAPVRLPDPVGQCWEHPGRAEILFGRRGISGNPECFAFPTLS